MECTNKTIKQKNKAQTLTELIRHFRAILTHQHNAIHIEDTPTQNAIHGVKLTVTASSLVMKHAHGV